MWKLLNPLGVLFPQTRVFCPRPLRAFLRGLAVVFAVSSLILLPASPVWAKTLRCEMAGSSHEVCILKIQRSAKKYWEYWAAVSVDGEKRPIETYNCRDGVRVRRDGILISFEQDVAGEVVCRLHVNKQTYLNRFNPPPRLSSED